MREKEYLQCLHFNCLLDEAVSNHSLPIVLPLSEKDKDRYNSHTLCPLTKNSCVHATSVYLLFTGQLCIRNITWYFIYYFFQFIILGWKALRL